MQYRLPQVPQRVEVDGLPIYWLVSQAPLAQVSFIWDAPAVRAYPAGLRRLLLRLLSEENGRYPAGELQRRLYRLGWELNWDADRDAIYLSAEGLTTHLTAALELLYVAIASPMLTGSVVSHHLRRFIETETRARANPSYLADSRLAFHLWGTSYHLTGSASLETLAEMDLRQLPAYYEEFMRKGLRAVVLAAPFLPDLLRRWASWRGNLTYELPVSLKSPQLQEVLPVSARQVSLRIAYPWVRPTHENYPYYRLALMRLGGYFGSQLMRSVREEGGLTYGIYARPDLCLAGSYMVISTEAARERITEAIDRIQIEVERWVQHPFPDMGTLTEVRNYLLLQMMPETTGEWSQRLTRLIGAGLSPDLFIAHAQAIDRLQSSEEIPALMLPHHPVVQLAVGTEQPIFAAACV